MKIMRGGIIASLLISAAMAQTGPARQEFEVASIRPSPAYTPGSDIRVGVHVDGAQIHCNFLTLKDYIHIGYEVKDYQVIGPEDVLSQHFDISAKLPDGANRDQVTAMLKSLITDRFKLKTHGDKKEFPVYGLTVAKGGPKLKESPLETLPEGAPAATNVQGTGGRGGVYINYGRGAFFSFADNKLQVSKLNMTIISDLLARFTDKPVVDMTDLKGTYDFTLEFSPEDFRAMQVRSAIAAGIQLPPEAMRALDYANSDSIFAALQTAGLKLESRKAPLDVVVVDHIEKSPTAN